jgi:hypothetical protein
MVFPPGGDEGDLNDRRIAGARRNPVWGPAFIAGAIVLVIVIAIAAALALL